MNAFVEAKEILNRPGAWTQGELARDALGRKVPPWSPEAKCWCLEGALRKVCQDPRDFEAALCHLTKYVWVVSTWNDEPRRTQRDVIELLEMVIG